VATPPLIFHTTANAIERITFDITAVYLSAASKHFYRLTRTSLIEINNGSGRPDTDQSLSPMLSFVVDLDMSVSRFTFLATVVIYTVSKYILMQMGYGNCSWFGTN